MDVQVEKGNLCRCCLSEDGNFRDLTASYRWMSETEVYADMLWQCFNINIGIQPFPGHNRICDVCVILLRDAYHLKKIVLQSQRQFVDSILPEWNKAQDNVSVKDEVTEVEPEDMKEEYPDSDEDAEKLMARIATNYIGAEASTSKGIQCKVEINHESVSLSSAERKSTAGGIQPNKQIDALHAPSIMQSPVSEQKKKADSSIKGKPLACKTCGNSFIKRCKLADHERIHTGDKPFKCDICGKSFHSKDVARSHKNNIHGNSVTKRKKDYKHECNTCGRRFDKKCNLSEHILTHGEKSVVCNTCGKSYYSQKQLEIHSRKIHRDKKIFICDTCGKVFKWKATLVDHLITHTGILPFACDVCSKCFPSLKRLNTHSKIHNKQCSCHICGASFSDKRTLDRHLLSHSANSLKCHICSKTFKVELYLATHIANVHSTAEHVSCHICGSNFKIEKYLKQHMVLVHGDARPFVCHVCGKTFKLKVILNDHLLRHENLKAYACHICKKTFTTPSDVCGHVKTVHQRHKQKRKTKCKTSKMA